MSLSKYKECGLLKIPGLFQNLCCVACSFKALHIDETIMRHIILQELSIRQIVDLQDPDLLQLYNQYSPTTRKAIVATCRNLEDYNATITHPGYYQPVTVDLECSINDSPIQIGQLSRGSIMEIFQATATSEFTISVLEQMMKDCTRIEKPATLYSDLPLVLRDTCVTLSVESQQYEVIRWSGQVKTTESFMFDDHIYFFDDLLDQYNRVLTLIGKVSMIVVDCTKAEGDAIPHVNDFMRMFLDVYGYLEGIFIVFVYSYADFAEQGIDYKGDAREIVNSDLDKPLRGRIFWLDLSSINEMIPEQDGPINMEINKLE